MTAASTSLPAVLAPGDSRREPLGRAVRRALVAALLFSLFTFATKEVRVVYERVPWAEDPYDTFVSFALFFAPLAVVAAVGRLALCRRAEPLPASRVAGLVRATWLALGASLVTLAADWAGVLLRWPAAGVDGFLAACIVALGVTSAAVVAAAAGLARVEVPRVENPAPDGLADGLALARLTARRLGPLARPVGRVVAFVEARLAPLVRRRPVTTAGAVSLAFAAVLVLAAAREEGVAPVLALVFGVAACAMFAFVVAGGAWLGLVAAPASSSARGRRLVIAATAGAAAVPASLAFRDAIWSLTRSGGARGLTDLALLVVVAGVLTFAVVLAMLTLGRRSGAPTRA